MLFSKIDRTKIENDLHYAHSKLTSTLCCTINIIVLREEIKPSVDYLISDAIFRDGKLYAVDTYSIARTHLGGYQKDYEIKCNGKCYRDGVYRNFSHYYEFVDYIWYIARGNEFMISVRN